jgi:hypothetical protein
MPVFTVARTVTPVVSGTTEPQAPGTERDRHLRLRCICRVCLTWLCRCQRFRFFLPREPFFAASTAAAFAALTIGTKPPTTAR